MAQRRRKNKHKEWTVLWRLLLCLVGEGVCTQAGKEGEVTWDMGLGQPLMQPHWQPGRFELEGLATYPGFPKPCLPG